MASHVCPWWGGYFIDNRLRRWLHNPDRILAPYVHSGMTVLDVGCGMGIFSIAMARLVGPEGRVLAVDIQQPMLDVLRKRAETAGVSERIGTHRCQATDLCLEQSSIPALGSFDLAFASYSVHEVPDTERLLKQVFGCLRPGGGFLVVEPIGHVPARQFARMVQIAESLGFQDRERPSVRLSRAVLLRRS